MKRTKRPTRAEKKVKFKTISTWLRSKEEAARKEEARKLNNEINPPLAA